MYRLKFRKSAAGIGALILGAVLVLGVPYNATTAVLIYDLPAAPFAAAQLILPFLFALSTYRACPFIQQMRAFLVTCSFIGFFGVLANINTITGFQVIQEEWLLHFNAAAFGTMNLAALIAATNLMQSEQMSSFADTQVAEAQLGRLKAVKVDPETQAKWEKAAAYADRSADGRSLRSTMTNLKAISLTEPGQELKPQLREPADRDKSKEKSNASRGSDDGSLANLLDRMDDEPLPGQGGHGLSDTKLDPALEGNSFINDVNEPEISEPLPNILADNAENYSFATGGSEDIAPGSFLDSILDAKIKEDETAERTDDAAPSQFAFAADGLDLPAEEAETTDVAALLDQFEDEDEPSAAYPETQSESEVELAAPDFSAPATDYSSPAAIDYSTPPEDFANTAQAQPESIAHPPETTRSSSFASASSSRSSMPAMQPLADATAESAPTSPTSTSPSGFTTASPGNTNNKLAAIKRRNTSTFTKLNALSASGSGPLMPTPQSLKEENEPDSLRSLLDRLDDDEPAADLAAKVTEAPKPIEPPVELTIDTVFKGDGVPEVAATPTSVAQPKAAVEAAPEAKVAEPEAAPVYAPEAAQQELAEEIAEAAGEIQAQDEEESQRENVFGDGVDSDIDNIFSELAPPEAQLEVKDMFTAKSSDVQPAYADESSTATGDATATGAEPAQPDQAEEEKEEEAEDAQSNLFGSGLDSEIDDIFSELAPPEAQKEVKDVLAAKAETAESAAPAQAVAAEVEPADEDSEGGLFGNNLGEELDNIFSELTAGEQLEVNANTLAKVKGGDEVSPPVAASAPPVIQPAIPAASAPAPVAPPASASPAASAPAAIGPDGKPAKYKEVKEFGRLSSKAPAVKVGGETGGTMKTIGKLLLDVQAVENIIKSGENRKVGSGLSTAKIISAARGEGIKNILNAIDMYEGVAGSLIVGHDGLVIASTVGTGWDKDMLGALSTALLSTSNLATKKLEIGKLKQMVMLTELTNGDGQKFKTTVLTDVDVGILAVFLEKTDLQKIDGLLETIHSTIHGG